MATASIVSTNNPSSFGPYDVLQSPSTGATIDIWNHDCSYVPDYYCPEMPAGYCLQGCGSGQQVAPQSSGLPTIAEFLPPPPVQPFLQAGSGQRSSQCQFPCVPPGVQQPSQQPSQGVEGGIEPSPQNAITEQASAASGSLLMFIGRWYNLLWLILLLVLLLALSEDK